MTTGQTQSTGTRAAEILWQLKASGSTGCLTVDSVDGDVGRIYVLFGRPFHAITAHASGTPALHEMLNWPGATTAFDAQAILPTQQTIGTSPSTAGREAGSWILRLSAILGLLLLVVLPLSAVGIAVWSIVQSLGPENAAATRYAAAPQCSLTTLAQDCYAIERGRLLSLSWSYGKFGARTDTLVISLPDGTHTVRVYFDVLGPRNIQYASSDGRVKLKTYQGHITELFAADGASLETSESPATGPQLGKGPQVVVIMFCGVWLLILAYALVRNPGAIKGTWKAITHGRLFD
jgi:hypothetical protein